MKQEFSFSELIKYILKRWYIILLACAIGIGAMMTYTFTRKTTEKVVAYEGGLTYIGNIDEIVAITDPVEKATALDIYKLIAERAINMMTSNEIKSTVFNQYDERMYLKYTSKSEKAKMFYKSLLIEVKGYDIIITFAYPVDNEQNMSLAREIIDSYVTAAIGRAAEYDATIVQSDIKVKNTVRLDDISPFVKELNSTDGIKGIIVDALIGAILGLFAGVLAACIIYAADRRIKSISGLPQTVKRVYGIIKSEADLSDALDLVASINGNYKKINFTTPAPDKKYIQYAFNFAVKCADEGYKTAVLDYSAGGGEFFKEREGLIFKSMCGQSSKIPKEADSLDKFFNDFDKAVIISPCGDSGSINCATFAEKTVIVIDNTLAKKSDIYNMCEMFEDVKAEVSGVILHSISYSFNN